MRRFEWSVLDWNASAIEFYGDGRHGACPIGGSSASGPALSPRSQPECLALRTAGSRDRNRGGPLRNLPVGRAAANSRGSFARHALRRVTVDRTSVVFARKPAGCPAACRPVRKGDSA